MPLPEDGSEVERSYDAGPTFDPYEPEEAAPVDSVQPTPISPDLLSDSAPDGGTREQTDSSPEEGEPKTQEKPLPQYPDEHREDFVGLLYLGRLSGTFRKFGHLFVVRTLTTEQLAEISQITKDYMGGEAYNAVYQSAVVAASVSTVDGQPLPGALTVNPLDDLQVRFTYVMRNWMPPVREKIYEECMALELTARKALTALGEASG
jgi:hypothetical protein